MKKKLSLLKNKLRSCWQLLFEIYKSEENVKLLSQKPESSSEKKRKMPRFKITGPSILSYSINSEESANEGRFLH